MFNKIWNFLKIWNEFITIPIAIVLWYFSDTFLRWIDITSATYDAGIFQIILFTIIQFLIYTGVIWIYMKITFPKMYKYLDDVVDENLKGDKMSNWEKTKTVLFVFGILLISMIMLSRVI